LADSVGLTPRSNGGDEKKPARGRKQGRDDSIGPE